MKNLEENLYNSFFSHIYIEEDAMNHPNTLKIINKFKNSKIIKISHYKDVFSRKNQDFPSQKKSQNLILAIKKDHLIYKGASVCEDFGNKNFYYTSSIMNCIYDCEYCYLQGMYTSANIVIFVNIEDIFNEVSKLLNKFPVYLCISYDTDLLAFENILGYTRKWINFAKNNKNLTIELRTKSANINAIADIPSIDNFILAWTLSPDFIIKNYEHRTASLDRRLENIKIAQDLNWNIRLCFDPMIYIKNYKKYYKELIEKTFSVINKDKICEISIGVFRVSSEYLKIIRKQRYDSPIVNFPFVTNNKVCSYNKNLINEMTTYLNNLILNYVPKHKIFI